MAGDKRRITPAQIQAVGRYEAAHYDKVLLRLPRDGSRDAISKAASNAGESTNAYILQAVQERMQREAGDE